jgi:hypothetical protein
MVSASRRYKSLPKNVSSPDTGQAGPNDWKPKYRHEFSKFVERFVYPHLGDVPIDRITPLDAQRWVNLILPTTQCITTQALFYLRLIFNQAERLELILRNPAKRVRVAKPPGQCIRAGHPMRCAGRCPTLRPATTLRAYPQRYIGEVTNSYRKDRTSGP